MPDEEAIKFECPHCAQSIESSSKNAGRTVDCPTCGKPFQVPCAKIQVPVPKNWSALRWIIPLVGLLPLLWWDYEGWKSKGKYEFLEDSLRWVLSIPFLIWVGIAWACTPAKEHGRFLAVLGCGIMAVAWWGLNSIPFLIVGGVVLLFGLTSIIVMAVKASKSSN